MPCTGPLLCRREQSILDRVLVMSKWPNRPTKAPSTSGASARNRCSRSSDSAIARWWSGVGPSFGHGLGEVLAHDGSDPTVSPIAAATWRRSRRRGHSYCSQ
jgi:hypothetical protein